ncbi:hypothetical protein NDU88_004654 [Pleurodeles waltl]|uniref:Uncharacterized protein n=1 Tax=Pleurodeles waltl TaxID=8319 RepID=A0AAV7UGC1_PLEWA|nr:hypothetical protein NDU88_004654 [Pleurodeles waltl]
MERVGATGLQLGVRRGSERGPRSWQQGYTASNPDRQWRPAQGDSALPRPAVDNQWLSQAASDTEGFIIGIWGLPGSNHRRFGCVFPRGCIRGRFLTGQRRVAPRPLVPSVSVVLRSGGTRPRPLGRRPSLRRQAPTPGAPACPPLFRVGP